MLSDSGVSYNRSHLAYDALFWVDIDRFGVLLIIHCKWIPGGVGRREEGKARVRIKSEAPVLDGCCVCGARHRPIESHGLDHIPRPETYAPGIINNYRLPKKNVTS